METSEKVPFIPDHQISAFPKDTSTSIWDWNIIRSELGCVHFSDEAITEQQSDIKTRLPFYFFEPVDYKAPTQSFSHGKEEKLGYWVGSQEDCGDVLTWKILTDTIQIIPRSSVRSVVNSTDAKLRLDPTGGEGHS